MPSLPIRPCLEPGCPHAATHRGRCALHFKERTGYEDRRRGTRVERGYTASWFRVVERAKKLQPYCSRCGYEGSKENPLTGDHILPKSQGGESVGSNVQVLCRVCNSRKGTRW